MKTWKEAVLVELEIQATAQTYMDIQECDHIIRGEDGSIQGYVTGPEGSASGSSFEITLHEKL